MRIIGGKYKGKKINTPLHEGTRPTSDRTRETIFNILLHNPAFGPQVVLGQDVLDVFAGTGALGLEAYSRGSKSVYFVENDTAALTLLKTNIKSFDLPPSCILSENAVNLRTAPRSFDLIFLDPPYHKDLVIPTLDQLLSKGWLSSDAVFVIEVAKDEIITLPHGLTLVTERVSGAAKVIFLKIDHTYSGIEDK